MQGADVPAQPMVPQDRGTTAATTEHHVAAQAIFA